MSVNIHGKEYFTVAERLNELNTKVENEYSLTAEMIYHQDGVVIFRATLKIGDNVYIGHAMEKEGSSMINKTSYIENAETSSWGRALSAANIIVEGDSSIASADEVATAIKNQGKSPIKQADSGEVASTPQINYIKKLCKERGISEDKYKFETMTKNEARDIIQVVMDTKIVEGN